LNPSEFDEVLRGRRTIGAFRPDDPPREAVLAALEVFRWAPNHRKTEPWRVFWLGAETKQQIVALNTRLIQESKGEAAAEAKRKNWSQIPGWLVVTCRRSEDPFLAEEDYAACSCAIQNLMLCLWARQIGSKWATGAVTQHAEFASLVGVNTAVERVIGLIWYGYPEVIPSQTRQPVDAFLVTCS